MHNVLKINREEMGMWGKELSYISDDIKDIADVELASGSNHP